MNTKEFPYPLPQQGKPITHQENLIQDLIIALGLIQLWSKIQREKGAKIMIELLHCPVEKPANRIDAMSQAQRTVSKDIDHW